jgi:hypothetical protein
MRLPSILTYHMREPATGRSIQERAVYVWRASRPGPIRALGGAEVNGENEPTAKGEDVLLEEPER